MRARPTARLVYAALVGACAVGCAPGAHRGVGGGDTTESYRAFIAAHPEDPAAEEAEDRLAELEFQEACRLHTPLAYKEFLEAHPRSVHAGEAKDRLEALRFNAAMAHGTREALLGFLKDHPDGAHRAEAEKTLARLEANAASDDPARADDEAFERARRLGPAELLAYLNDFPAGGHRAQARLTLFSLKLDGLLFSGLVDEARAEARSSPLAEGLKDLPARIARAERLKAALATPDPLIQAGQARFYVRELRDLVQAQDSPDALDRWEAALEMGQQVTIESIDPLLRVLRAGRNPLERRYAFDSLVTVMQALPAAVAQYELATRLAKVKGESAGPELYLTVAVLLDLSGQRDAAATEYRRAFDPADPDPVLLHRWMELREERRQPFSAAVAARQLALWAQGVASAVDVGPEAGVSLVDARRLCAAAEEARAAKVVVDRAGAAPSDFPEDLKDFARIADGAVRLTRARLEDVELVLQTKQRGIRTCNEHAALDRIRAGVGERLRSLRELDQRRPGLAEVLWETAEQRDPSPEVRAAARARRATASAHGR